MEVAPFYSPTTEIFPMETTDYENMSDNSTAYSNITDINANVTKAAFISTIPKMVNLLGRPVWIITGTIGKYEIKVSKFYCTITAYNVLCSRVSLLRCCGVFQDPRGL